MIKKILITLFLLFFSVTSAMAYSNPRWFSMPVSVYIPNAPQTATVMKAFREWQKDSGGTVRFLFRRSHNTERLSKISVVYVDTLSNGEPYVVEQKYTSIGKRHMDTSRGYFYKLRIIIARRSAKGKYFTTAQTEAIALRAVGEALGVPADGSKGVMAETFDFSNRHLLKQDIDALNKVYKK